MISRSTSALHKTKEAEIKNLQTDAHDAFELHPMMLESLLRSAEKSGLSQTRVECLHGLHVGPQKGERIHSQRARKLGSEEKIPKRQWQQHPAFIQWRCLLFENQVIAKVGKIASDLSWSHRSGPDQNVIVHNSSHIWRTRKLHGKRKDQKSAYNL